MTKETKIILAGILALSIACVALGYWSRPETHPAKATLHINTGDTGIRDVGGWPHFILEGFDLGKVTGGIYPLKEFVVGGHLWHCGLDFTWCELQHRPTD